jgi:hypothetical protein
VATKLPLITAKSAAEIAIHFELSPEGAKALLPAMDPAAFFDALSAGSHFGDAVNLLAHGLGRREAVWWACLCAKATIGDAPAPASAAALAAAETWCWKPTEENRRAAHAAAEAAQFKTAAAWAAMGAFWSGGSMAPASAPQPVPPGPFLTAKAVSTSITLAAVQREPEKGPARYKDFLAKGVVLANAVPEKAG